jgi:adenine phosphoribosyltransferase
VSPDAGWLESYIRDVPDFPEPGIMFKDLTPLLGDAEAFRVTVDALADHAATFDVVDKVVGVEARGFTFAAAVAYKLGVGLVPVRKPGKLPWDTLNEAYDLEYGSDSLEVHKDAVSPGQGVYVIDDVLATGGTAAATCRLLEGLGGRVVGLAFVVELGFLKGRAKLTDHGVTSLVTV